MESATEAGVGARRSVYPVLKDKITGGARLLGPIVKMPSPGLIELLGAVGFDFVLIDTEHGPADSLELEHHIRAADTVDLPVLVRVPGLIDGAILSALDAGAAGIVVPHVSSSEQAADAVSAAHYPPHGRRSLALSTRAGRHGKAELGEHLAAASAGTVVIVQIEDPAGVADARGISSTPAVDAVWLGLNDLAISLAGTPGARDQVFEEAVRSTAEIVLASPAALAIADTSREGLESWFARGVTLALVPLATVVAMGGADLLNARH